MSFDFKNASKEELDVEYKRISEEIGDDQFFTKKELNFLPEILMDNEDILAFTSGYLDGNTWLITLTDKRIIFLDKGMIYGLKQTFIDLSNIQSVSGTTGLLFGKIVISEGSASHEITNVWKKTVKIFTNRVQEAMEAKRQVTGNEGSAQETDDVYDKIRKIAELKAAGIMTDEEFQAEKTKLLAQT